MIIELIMFRQIERFIKTIYAADSLSCKPWKSGQIERRFIEVPFGATWVEATMRTYGFDTARRFFIDTVQLSPLQRPIKWESVATFSSPSSKNFVFRVEGGQTMELAIAQFWSSGIGSHETTIVDFEEFLEENRCLEVVFRKASASSALIVEARVSASVG
uniref:Tripeptidyl-peptidase II galactose-binding domain-containing protein n=1 Tax=Solanum lycopersicum TaxID=4081 RepID=A0A3Q7FH88_SOLLC